MSLESDHRRLLETIDYNPETGIALYRVRRGCQMPGSRVGSIYYGTKRSKPYRYVAMGWLFTGVKPFTHIVHFYMTGYWPLTEMDHIHGDTLDDRWLELRPATRDQNEANRGPRRHNSTGYKGVCPHANGRFSASIYRRGKRAYLGRFGTPEAAHAAYSAAAKVLDGQFAWAA